MYEGRRRITRRKKKDFFFAESPFNEKKEATREDRCTVRFLL